MRGLRGKDLLVAANNKERPWSELSLEEQKAFNLRAQAINTKTFGKKEVTGPYIHSLYHIVCKRLGITATTTNSRTPLHQSQPADSITAFTLSGSSNQPINPLN